MNTFDFINLMADLQGIRNAEERRRSSRRMESIWEEMHRNSRVVKPDNAKLSADGKWYWVEIGPNESKRKLD